MKRKAYHLSHTKLTGKIEDAFVQLDTSSRWFSPENSRVALVGKLNEVQLDAPEGVTIMAVLADSKAPAGQYALPSGGKLIVK